MFTKQGNSRNKVNIKRITLYAMLVAVCLIIGYLENLLSITLIAIAPGVKLGLSNAVVLILAYSGDKKGAWAVNVARICLSALLFGSPISFLLSLSGGLTSTAVACALSGKKNISPIGISIAAAVTHNTFQLVAAMCVVGFGVCYYLPILILLGSFCGALCGILTKFIFKYSKIFKF